MNYIYMGSCFQNVAGPRLHRQLVAADEQHTLNMLKEYRGMLYSGNMLKVKSNKLAA
jgi:hypothetical protein